jgi:hypothetical protein
MAGYECEHESGEMLRRPGGERDTWTSLRAVVTATTPAPQATSSTFCPGLTCAYFTNLAAGILVEISTGTNAAQASR